MDLRIGLPITLSTIMSAAAVGSPQLSMDFANAPSLVSAVGGYTATHTRASHATQYDSTGKLTFAPNNLLNYSDDLTNANWQKNGVTAVAVDRVTENTATSVHYIWHSTFTPSMAGRFTYQAKVKADGRSSIYLVVSYLGATEWTRVRFNLAAGTAFETADGAGSGPVLVSYGISATSVADEYLVHMTVDVGAVAVYTYIGLADTLGSIGSASWGLYSYTGDGASGLYVRNAQAERVTYETTPRTFNATTSAAYYGPRYDYNPATLAARGMRIEAAATNLLTNSNTFSAWTLATPGALTANTTTSPDGRVNASTLTDDQAAAFTSLYTDVAVAANASSYTMSVYIKKTSGATTYPAIYMYLYGGTAINAYVTLNTNTGALYENTSNKFDAIAVYDAGDYWRVAGTKANNSTNTSLRSIIYPAINAGTSGTLDNTVTGSVVIYGAQTELGSEATSYIPTGASSVTRSADVVSMTGSDFTGWYKQAEGTFAVEFEKVNAANSGHLFAASDNTTNNCTRGYVTTALPVGLVAVGGVAQASLVNPASIAPNRVSRTALAYKLDDFSCVTDGGTATTDTSGTVPTVTHLYIGSINGVTQLNGWIKSFRYFNTRKTNEALRALTTWDTPNPTLYWDFSTSPSLTDQINSKVLTFSRAGHAAQYDSTGKITYAPNNEWTYSDDLTQGVWIAGAVSKPAANQLVEDGTTAEHYFYRSITPAVAGRYTVQAKVKANGRNTVYVSAGYGPVTQWSAQSFDISAGVANTAQAGAGAGPTLVAGSIAATGVADEYLVSVTFDLNAAITYIVFGTSSVSNPTFNASTGRYSYAGDNASGIYVRNLQAERVTYETTPRTFNATTSATYYGPRYDYHPSTLAPRGLLIETTRTNYYLFSLDAVQWPTAKSGTGSLAVKTYNAGVAPDGRTTATKILLNLNGGTTVGDQSTVFFTSTALTAAATYTGSAWIKAATVSEVGKVVCLRGVDSGTYASATLTSEWQRIQYARTASGTTGSFSIELRNGVGVASVPDTVEFLLWQPQLENGAVASSPIMTNGAAVTRASETCSLTGSAFSSVWSTVAGAVLIEAENYDASVSKYYWGAADGSSNNIIYAFMASDTSVRPAFVAVGAATQASLSTAASTFGVARKVATSWQQDFVAGSCAGSNATPDTAANMPPGLTALGIGSNGYAAGLMDGWVKNFRYYNEPIRPPQLERLAA